MNTLKNIKGISTPAILLAVVLILAAGSLAWWGVIGGNIKRTKTNVAINISNINLNTDLDRSTWKNYKNTAYNYNVVLPKDWLEISPFDGSCCYELHDNSSYLLLGTEDSKGVFVIDSTQYDGTVEEYAAFRKYNERQISKIVNTKGIEMNIFVKDGEIKEGYIDKYIFIISTPDKKNELIELKMNELNDINKAVVDSFTFM
ncbi:MAG: hypothetical protein Q8P56_06550 [Candidatus Uhrbacteria bacterium]|nr:hypothetical protein [Candidatus Uhrbacteria bacterium]